MTTPQAHVDKVYHLLTNYGWAEQPNMEVKGGHSCLVFSLRVNGKLWKMVIGPLWTTHYYVVKDVIYQMDSIKTEKYELIEYKVLEISK